MSGMLGETGESVASREGVLRSAELSRTNPRLTSTLVSPATRYPKVKVSGDSSPKEYSRGDNNVALRGNKMAEGDCKANKDTVAI